ncbi:related to DOPA 4,5-dioxygenase EC=1.14.99.--Amanita muscaria [Serendipita indica DSM 11827]|uniref:WGS project CAFZ00000000 data, contig PIRI_contig_0092 n=1 Tax=Serendipita indica (strain DSM 11827) TaxID=1109443 RepID=G4TGX6_SERID|nr:related to DOPA 4,5-dioxygenase EC=1.14.99.--Amanita muscaria [Serendipita indica DSM 11827]
MTTLELEKTDARTVEQEQQHRPPADLETVLKDEIKEYHFHIYFHQKNEAEHKEALALRDSVLKLRKQGAFVAVPLWRVNEWPMGPHPVGSYEIWCPTESFSSVFSYLCQHHGSLSVLIHPLTKHERLDHSHRNAWIGAPFPLDLSTLPVFSPQIPLQYASLSYSSQEMPLTKEQRERLGRHYEGVLKGEPEAAPAPGD